MGSSTTLFLLCKSHLTFWSGLFGCSGGSTCGGAPCGFFSHSIIEFAAAMNFSRRSLQPLHSAIVLDLCAALAQHNDGALAHGLRGVLQAVERRTERMILKPNVALVDDVPRERAAYVLVDAGHVRVVIGKLGEIHLIAIDHMQPTAANKLADQLLVGRVLEDHFQIARLMLRDFGKAHVTCSAEGERCTIAF